MALTTTIYADLRFAGQCHARYRRVGEGVGKGEVDKGDGGCGGDGVARGDGTDGGLVGVGELVDAGGAVGSTVAMIGINCSRLRIRVDKSKAGSNACASLR